MQDGTTTSFKFLQMGGQPRVFCAFHILIAMFFGTQSQRPSSCQRYRFFVVYCMGQHFNYNLDMTYVLILINVSLPFFFTSS